MVVDLLGKTVTSKTIGPPMTGRVLSIIDGDYFNEIMMAPLHWGDVSGPIALVRYTKPQRDFSIDEYLGNLETSETSIEAHEFFTKKGYSDQQVYEMVCCPVPFAYYPLSDLEEV
jgi:hypothetical protein